MDRVSELLEAHERHPAKRFPYVIAATALHLGVVFGVFAAAQLSPRAHDLLPSVAVRLVAAPAPEPMTTTNAAPSTSEPTTTEPESKPEPEPPREPPVPEPEPETVTEPVSETTDSTVDAPADTDQAPSGQAMPQPDRPAATPAPTPPRRSSRSTSRGLSLGDGSAGSGAAIPSDFQFTYYVERMLALIESRWYKPPVPSGTRTLIRFRIARDGRLSDIVLERSSGAGSFDRAALRALYAANPLPPLPPAYRKPSLTVHLVFSE